MLRAAILVPALVLSTYCAPDGAGDPGPEPTAGSASESSSGGEPRESLPEGWGRAVELHNTGFAALENEQPAEAESAYEELTSIRGDDPMPWANLAVARLRQQETADALAAVDEGLKRAPEGSGAIRGSLLAIRGAVLDWEGRGPEALEAYRKAAEASPGDPQILFTLYRQAVSLGDDEPAGVALERLVEVRPENFVVLVERGKRAVQEDDRAAATKVFLRLRELLWQAPPIAETALQGVLDALETGDPPSEAARVPAARLENVLKVTPMYRESLRELSSGIQAVPVPRFATAPPDMELGDPLPITFAGEPLSEVPTRGRALALGDFDGDGVADVARILDRDPARIEVRRSGGAGSAEAKGEDGPEPSLAAAGATGLLATDLDNDGFLDLLAHGPGTVTFWNGADGALTRVEAGELGLEAGGSTAAAFDYDIEGDLDLVLAGREAAAGGDGAPPPLELYRNSLEGSLEAVGAKVFPDELLTNRSLAGGAGVREATSVDLDRDGDTDLVLAVRPGGDHGGLLWLDNLRQGLFADRTAEAGLADAPAAAAVLAADLDNDGRPELVTASDAGDGISVWSNRIDPASGKGTLERIRPAGLPTSGSFRDLVALDLDNDGRLDLAAAGPEGVAAFGQRATGDGPPAFRALPVEGGPGAAAALAGADLDGDGDLDLIAAGPDGLHRLINRGGHENGWLAVRLQGLSQGNSKNNRNGVGAAVEVRTGSAYQLREHDGRVSHFGLGRHDEAQVVRVVWTNGVPQNRIGVAGGQTIVEEQVLKGSCPFLYTYTGAATGEGIEFVTDLLWGAPAGLPVAPGVYAPADPDELVEVAGAESLPGEPGVYDLRITEELWEAAYFDHVRLWVVDHPADVEVASNLKIVPGEAPPEEDRVLAARAVRPVTGATDGRGRDVTSRVRERDHVYADGYRRSRYQGVAAAPWSLTFDLGPAAAERPGGGPVRLLLDGWIFPTDASLNLALAQRDGSAPHPPRLEVETADGWKILLPNMGHPAGKTKTMVVDTPPLPEGARRLRIVTEQWISWDRIAWSPTPDDGAARVVSRVAPETAELRYRGFSEELRRAPNAPHEFDYAQVSRRSPWEPTPGPYTKYGDVRELLTAPDDRSVILAAGDELALRFDTSDLPAPPAGWERTLFLESHGWDKDFDRNTYAVDRGSLPLPFHGMGVYGPGLEDQDAPDLEGYVERWLTRQWPGPPGHVSDEHFEASEVHSVRQMNKSSTGTR